LYIRWAALLSGPENKKIYDADGDESDGDNRYPKVFFKKSLGVKVPCADGASSGC
jgi:hypothetical protein